MIPQVSDVTRAKSKASILIEGLSGQGKSGLALEIAHGLCPDWSKIVALDTENRSLPLYLGETLGTGDKIGTFKYAQLLPSTGYKPSFYQAYQDWGIQNGMEVFVQDSISHMWQQAGGILDMVSEAQAKNTKLNKWTAWGVPEIMAEKQLIISLIRNEHMHVISTVRVKEKLDMDKDDDGKSIMKSLGEQQITMPDLKYEPDLVLTMVSPGYHDGTCSVARVSKSRYSILEKDQVYQFTPALIESLRKYLDEGVDPEELLKQQHADYIAAVKEFLDGHPDLVGVWNILKANAGMKDVKLAEIPLNKLRFLFGQLAAD